MKKFLLVAAIAGSLAATGSASGKDLERKSQRYGTTESAACEKAKADARDRLGNAQFTGFDSCTCGIGTFTKPGASNRYWCRTVAHGRHEPRNRPPASSSTPR